MEKIKSEDSQECPFSPGGSRRGGGGREFKMAEKLLLKIVSPQGIHVEEEVEEVTAPGTLGEFGVLAGHTNYLTSLRAGTVSYVLAGNQRNLSIPGGMAEIRAREVILLVPSIPE